MSYNDDFRQFRDRHYSHICSEPITIAISRCLQFLMEFQDISPDNFRFYNVFPIQRTDGNTPFIKMPVGA